MIHPHLPHNRRRDPHGLQRLITALDVDSLDSARALMRLLRGHASLVKIGWRLFMAVGFDALRLARDEGFGVFLDLKLGDIPATVTAAVCNLRERLRREKMEDGVVFFTLQGSPDCVRAARLGRGESPLPLLLMVAWLSSEGEGKGEGEGEKVSPATLRRAEEAVAFGCDGLVASGTALSRLRRAGGDSNAGNDIVLVVPGVRLAGGDHDDHRRILTPAAAVAGGADYVVVGRPLHGLHGAGDRRAVLEALAADIARGEEIARRREAGMGAQKFGENA